MEPSATRIAPAKARGMLQNATLSVIHVGVILGRRCSRGAVTPDSGIFPVTLSIILNLIIMR